MMSMKRWDKRVVGGIEMKCQNPECNHSWIYRGTKRNVQCVRCKCCIINPRVMTGSQQRNFAKLRAAITENFKAGAPAGFARMAVDLHPEFPEVVKAHLHRIIDDLEKEANHEDQKSKM